jgi:hypothetical protein
VTEVAWQQVFATAAAMAAAMLLATLELCTTASADVHWLFSDCNGFECCDSASMADALDTGNTALQQQGQHSQNWYKAASS